MNWQPFLDAIDSPAMILDLQCCIHGVNGKTSDLSGLAVEKLVGLRCYEVLHKQSAPPENCPLKSLLSSGKASSSIIEFENLGKTFRVSVLPLFNGRDKFEKILHYAEDITASVSQNEALQKSEEKFRTMMDFTYDWEYWLGLDGEFIYTSSSVERLTGYSPEEFYADSSIMERIIHPDDLSKVVNHHHEKMKNGTPSQTEFRIINKSGEIRWLGHGCQKIYSEDGKYLGIRGSNRDISDKKEIELSLFKSQSSLQSILDSAPLGIIFTDNDRVISFVNQRTFAMFGFTADEILGRSARLFYGSEDEFMRVGKLRHEQLQHFAVSALVTQFMHKNGSPIELYMTSAWLCPDEHEQGFVASFMDISELKKSEKNRIALQLKLIEARKTELINTLAGGVAHDFNNALTTVIGNVELLGLDLSESDNKSCLQAIETSAYYMADLTKQLLAFAGGGRYHAQEINLEEFIRNAIDEFTPAFKGNVEVCRSLNCLESKIVTDSSQLKMVFNAILTNAFEATSGHGVIEISCYAVNVKEFLPETHIGWEYDTYHCFSIRDNGSGMNQETLKRIYEPFYSTKFAGRGLGMAAVHGIIKNNGGHIMIDSTPGKGTTVRVFLPPAYPESVSIVERKTEQTVLVVEDVQMLQYVQKKLLEAIGYKVLLASNGMEALQFVKNHNMNIDVALLDVHLPDITADILYAKLIELQPSLKVLLCSGSALEWTAQKALNLGAEGFIQKPFSINNLREQLATILAHD